MDVETFLASLVASGSEIDQLVSALASRDIRTRGPAQRQLLRWPTSEAEERLLALLRVLDYTRDPFGSDVLLDDRSLSHIIQNLFVHRGKKAQAALFGALHDPLPLVRETAICALSAMGDAEAFPVVYQALIHDPQLEYYYLYLIEALASLSAPQHLDLMLPFLTNGDDEQRRVTAVCVEQIGPPAVSALLPLLEHEQAAVRGIVAALLGTLRDPQVIDALIALLEDKEASVRRWAVQALHQLRARQALPKLREALRDEALEVREAALWAVPQLDEAQAFQTYCDALHDPEPEMCSQALFRLGHLKDPRAADILLSLLHDDPVEWWGIGTFGVLAELGDKRAFEPLLAALADPEQCDSAITSLGTLGDPRAVEPLLAAFAASREGTPLERDAYDGELAFGLHDSSGWTRDCIIVALSKLGDPRATETIIAALDDPGHYVQSSACRGLGMLRDQRAVTPLLKRLREKQNSSVAQPLVAIGGTQALEGLYEVLLEGQHYRDYVYHDVAKALRPLQRPVPTVLVNRLRQAKTAQERTRAATILGALGDPQTFSALLATANDEQEDLSVRIAAVEALGELDGERALEPLLTLLTSEPLSILRAKAAFVLGSLTQPEALHPLLRALEDQSSLVRAIAAHSLQNFQDPQVIPALQAMIAREVAQDDDFEDYTRGLSYFKSPPGRLTDHLPEEHAQAAIAHYKFMHEADNRDRKVIFFRTEPGSLQAEQETE